MHIHILGICGTFMSGVAIIAKQMGHRVTGSDESVYPPMSTQLAAQGIELMQGYDPKHLDPAPDCVIIGNAIKRGNPIVEYVLDNGLSYTSGPQWLAENVLSGRWVLAVAGTHGKTTTSSMLAWIMEYSGMPVGFLIGGIPGNFGVSARFSNVPFFVIEADEYDSAFFDKRSKFLHFHPRTLILNCLEYDHADIFPNLEAIKTQFHYLLRTVPGSGLIVAADNDKNIQEMVQQDCWTPVQTYDSRQADWRVNLLCEDASEFEVYLHTQCVGVVRWGLLGQHNAHNALAAIAAANHAGVSPEQAITALCQFEGVKRRMEFRGQVQGVSVYDDFAHHPTAIAATLTGLRAKVKHARLIVLVEFASYTMRAGVHRDHLASAFKEADYVLFLKPELDWNIEELLAELPMTARVHKNIEEILADLMAHLQPGDHVVIMSNRGFGGIHEKLLDELQQTQIIDSGSHIFV